MKGTTFERALLSAAAAGEWLDGQTGRRRPAIRAAYLRALLLRLAPGTRFGPVGIGRVEIAPPGIRIRNATILGDLDLTDATDVDGQSLPSLVLENCDINGQIWLDHARIDRLSLRGSSLRGLRARQAIFGGTVDLASVHAFGSPDAECWLVLDGARIDGDLNLCECVTRAPTPRPTLDAAMIPVYAIQATGIEISGQVQAMNATAHGGITLRDASVSGEAWFRGTHVSAGERYAFNAQNANFQTGLMLDSFEGDRRFEAVGDVWMLGCQTTTCQLDGGKFGGSIVLSQGRIAGTLSCESAELCASSSDGWAVALTISGAKIGNMRVTHCHIMGSIDGRLLEVDRDVELYGSQLILNDTETSHPLISLDLARIGGDLQFDLPDQYKVALEKALLSQGPISIDGADIGGNLLVDRAKVRSGFDGVRTFAFSAVNTKVGFDASFVLFASQGTVSLSGLSVGRKFRVELAWPFSAEDDQPLATRLLWDLSGASALLLCDQGGRGWDKNFPVNVFHRPGITLDGFEYGSIERLTTESLDDRQKWLDLYVPNLVSARSHRSLGDDVEQARAILRDLTFSATSGRNRVRRGWRRFRRWVTPDQLTFAPQPFLQLASVYRRNGRDADADHVLRMKMRRDGLASGQPKRVLWLAFDRLFGFGFRPVNAFATVFVLLGMGAVGTNWANTHGGLSIDASPVATVAGSGRSEGALPSVPLPALQVAARNFKTELPCGAAINSALYAADVFVPLIDLRQESKCEPTGGGWVVAKALYAVLGWIVTSLALLTVSGILRRDAERE